MYTVKVQTRRERWQQYWRLIRPFTLITAATGIVATAIMGWLASDTDFTLVIGLRMLFGAFVAMAFNAGTNALNQIYDLEIDRINKPQRPLVTGKLTLNQVWRISILTYSTSLIFAFLLSVETFIVIFVATMITLVYSIPPFRIKRWGVLANLAIATSRGLLLTLSGWTVTNTFLRPDPWYIGMVLTLFLLGAATTKDFTDMEGDAAFGCKTLPIRLGVITCAYVITPFLVFPFLLLPIGAFYGWVAVNQTTVTAVAMVLTSLGGYIAWLIARDPEAMTTENHPSWALMHQSVVLFFAGICLAFI